MAPSVHERVTARALELSGGKLPRDPGERLRVLGEARTAVLREVGEEGTDG